MGKDLEYLIPLLAKMLIDVFLILMLLHVKLSDAAESLRFWISAKAPRTCNPGHQDLVHDGIGHIFPLPFPHFSDIGCSIAHIFFYFFINIFF